MTPSPPSAPRLESLGAPGPSQGQLLVHFTGRPSGTAPNPQLDPAIAALTPEERLRSILWDGAITGTSPFRQGLPTVSFSEASSAHLHWLIHARFFPSWGLIYDRQAVYAAGGGPVWHARPAQYDAALAAELDPWVVRLDTTAGAPRSEWMHEQEWRVQADRYPATTEAGLIGVLVGNAEWTPADWLEVKTGRLVDATGAMADGSSIGTYEETEGDWYLPPDGSPTRFMSLSDSLDLHPLPPGGLPTLSW